MRARLAVAILAFLPMACATARPDLALSPGGVLATRAAQTRTYAVADRRLVITALVQAFQDAGFQVSQVEPETGFISANAQSVTGKRGNPVLKSVLWPYAMMLPGLFGGNRQVVATEATATVITEEGAQRVRISCRRRVSTDSEIKSMATVSEPAFYQDLFARVDKALFLAGQGL